MDFGLAFTYIFKDPNWVKKVLIGGVLLLLFFLVVPIFFTLGYFIKTIRNVAEGKENPLPEWADWGGLFVSGAKLFIVLLIYFGVPAFIVLAFILLGDARVFPLLMLLIFFVSVAAYVFSPAITMQLARREDIGDAFNFSEILKLTRARLGDYAIITSLYLASGYVAEVGLLALIVGVVFTLFYINLVHASLYGQYLRLYEQKAVETMQ